MEAKNRVLRERITGRRCNWDGNVKFDPQRAGGDGGEKTVASRGDGRCEGPQRAIQSRTAVL